MKTSSCEDDPAVSADRTIRDEPDPTGPEVVRDSDAPPRTTASHTHTEAVRFSSVATKNIKITAEIIEKYRANW